MSFIVKYKGIQFALSSTISFIYIYTDFHLSAPDGCEQPLDSSRLTLSFAVSPVVLMPMGAGRPEALINE